VIDVTRLGGGALVINVDLILSIEQTPDTMIVFANGEKLLVLETPAVIVERALAYRKQFGLSSAAGYCSGEAHAG
jgi:flagellar protein FlbD